MHTAQSPVMIKKIAPLFFLCLGIFSCANNQNEADIKPNVIIIFTDDQGYQDIGCFGSPDIRTPHLDKMAEEGIKLTDFYAAQAVCSASRAGLLTGCYPNRLGVHGAFMPNSKQGLNLSETTMAEMLKTINYKTGIFGKWHLGDTLISCRIIRASIPISASPTPTICGRCTPSKDPYLILVRFPCLKMKPSLTP